MPTKVKRDRGNRSALRCSCDGRTCAENVQGAIGGETCRERSVVRCAVSIPSQVSVVRCVAWWDVRGEMCSVVGCAW